MKPLTLFRILTFVLIPIGSLFGIMALMLLLSAMANPTLFLGVFLFACLMIYAFASLSFLTKGIDRGLPCRPSLRDWIRVNAFVCLFMCFMFLVNSIGVFTMNPANLKEMIAKMMEMQPNMPATVNPEFFYRMIRVAAGFMLMVGVVLSLHIFLNFRMLKQYRHLFGDQGTHS